MSAAARLLKERTSDAHARVEIGLDLVDPGLDPRRLRDVLVRFHAFWAGTEPVIDAWAALEPDVAEALQWARRRRTSRLARDVAALSGVSGPPAPPVFDTVDRAGVLGWLYVSEGSTLGGAVISRALARCGHPVHLESFVPYVEGPGPMWRDFQTQLARWTDGDELFTERVVTAGAATFEALATWVAPLTKERAA